ncbi:MAG: TolC family protein [Alloprevotella sp.]|nr:TolC family protein [Alloprevotella sp.]
MKHIFILALSLTSIGLSAQRTMTLRDCIDYAIERNVQVKLQEVQRRSQEVNLSSARNARLPQLAGGVNQSFSFGRGLTADNTYANRNTMSTSFNVGMEVPLFTGFRLPNQKKQAELDLQAATAELDHLRDNLSVQVTQAYLQALYQQELIRVAEHQVELGKAQQYRVERFYANDKVSGLEVSEAKNVVAQDELQLVQQQNAYNLALLDLAQLIEMENPDSLAIVSPTSADISAILSTPQTIFQQALMQKPAIKAQQIRIESAERGIAIARSGYWPTLSLSAGLGSSYYKVSGYDATAFHRQLKDNFSKSIGLSLSIPIFNGFSTRNQIRQAKLQAETARLQLDQVEKDLFKEIQTAWYNARAAQKKYEASQQAEAVALESFQMMTKKYEFGKANATEFSEQKTKYANAVCERLQAQYEFLFRMKILEFYKGNEIR